MKNPIIRYLVQQYLKATPKTIKAEQLEFIGVDSKGMKYYSWADLEAIPKSRVGQLQNFALLDDMKMNAANLQLITDKIIEVNNSCMAEKAPKNKGKHHAQIGALALEMQWRTQYDTPVDIVLNIAAAVAVREDEDPLAFNNKIHDEKVERFKAEEKDGNFFFINHKVLGNLKPSLIMSADELKSHFNKLMSTQAHQDLRLQTILHGSRSKNETKQTTN